jgi:hypothetical protein
LAPHGGGIEVMAGGFVDCVFCHSGGEESCVWKLSGSGVEHLPGYGYEIERALHSVYLV